MSGTITGGMLATIAYMTGVDSSGALTAQNGWTSSTSVPPTYSTSQSAHKWAGGAAGTGGGVVSYWFDAGSKWTAAEMAAWRGVFALWSAEANITFVPAATQAAAMVTLTRSSATDSGGDAEPTNTPGSAGSTTIPAISSVAVNLSTAVGGGGPLTFTDEGAHGLYSAVHEIGHVLGLSHTGPYDGTVNAATQQYSAYDVRQWSVMSYIEPSQTEAAFYSQYTVTGTNWNGNDPTTPMPLDILAAQRLYGAPVNSPLNNVTFGYNCTVAGDARPFFDFTQNTTPVVTLFATGSSNTLDLSGETAAANVNLNPLTFSSVNGLVNNIGIASGTAINTVIGGSFNDSFTVNANSDTITGGGGNDTVVFGATDASYVVGQGSGGTITLTSGAVTDTLAGIRTLRFADQSVATANLTSATATQVLGAYAGVLRVGTDAATLAQTVGQITAGTLSLSQLVTGFIATAGTSTVPAAVTYDAFYGALPAAAGLDALTQFALGLPALGFSTQNIWVNLGASFAANGMFAAAYGAMTRDQFVTSVYGSIFGGTQDAAGHADFVNSLTYYAGYAGSELGARGAVEALLLYSATQSAGTAYARAAGTFLQAAAAGTATYQVGLLATYGQAA